MRFMEGEQRMHSVGLSGYALTIGVAATLLAGCAGTQPPIAAPGAARATFASAGNAGRGGAWMRPDVKAKNLLYVASNNIVNVYTYPAGQLVGSLGSFNSPGGLCVNKKVTFLSASFTIAKSMNTRTAARNKSQS
jgi:hypothetical protein